MKEAIPGDLSGIATRKIAGATGALINDDAAKSTVLGKNTPYGVRPENTASALLSFRKRKYPQL